MPRTNNVLKDKNIMIPNNIILISPVNYIDIVDHYKNIQNILLQIQVVFNLKHTFLEKNALFSDQQNGLNP